MLGINHQEATKLSLIVIMLVIAPAAQYMFMAYSRNEYWLELCKTKRVATLGMGSIASTLTGLWLFDMELSATRYMFWMFIASLVGGEGVQLVVRGAFSKLVQRVGGALEKEKLK